MKPFSMQCRHDNTICLNEFELICKYRCLTCGNVMICACDEAFGRHFLSHQLDLGMDRATRKRVPVTIGFQPSICRECRGLPAEAHPKAAIYGRTSKIKRYYWREIHRRQIELFAEWALPLGLNPLLARTPEAKLARKKAGQQALQEIKQLHEKSPKYTFGPEDSQADIFAKCNVDILSLEGIYVRDQSSKRAMILCGETPVSAEEFVCHHFESLGHEALFVESVPFHVLFGVFMWLAVQDPSDDHVRIVGFGDRLAFDEGRRGKEILSHLPEDFGSSAYEQRRRSAINYHFAKMLRPEDLEWLFEYWLEPSVKLRQYLWAHRAPDIEMARRLVKVLPKETLLRILRYLVGSYWERYVGWPDLIVLRGAEFCFVEVKSSSDELSADQKRWIRDNHETLRLPFKLAKIHRKGIVNASDR